MSDWSISAWTRPDASGDSDHDEYFDHRSNAVDAATRLVRSGRYAIAKVYRRGNVADDWIEIVEIDADSIRDVE